MITFQELSQIFAAVGINPAECEEDQSDHSSAAGRMYAVTGGVSQAVTDTLKKIRPEKKIKIKAVQADGIRKVANYWSILNNEIEANFYEGMGCVGGCVGGPSAIFRWKKGKAVLAYGREAEKRTPADNLAVLTLLKAVGFQEIDQLYSGRSPTCLNGLFSYRRKT